ncbi:MAG: CRISPR system precrRNA processing endoribonuclease RAMP protein Cas6 [Deltaproteobacteria bacterium]|nr:CRISPR system precrRNA processing endoribonuclease RAMP protein Cas6 [Deltaproteobacteria bacterium]
MSTFAPLPRLPLATWARRVQALDLRATELEVAVNEPFDALDPINSRIRGILGARLRDAWCLTGEESCEGCCELENCHYGRTFETPAEVARGPSHGSHGVHPFWLSGIPTASRLSAGSTFSAKLTLAGPDADLLPSFEAALADAVLGLGPRRLRGRLLTLASPRRSTPTIREEAAPTLSIRSLTPLILRPPSPRAKDECPAAPWLIELMRAGVRRLGSLSNAFTRVERAAADLPELGRVEAIEGTFTPTRLVRHSQRQRARVPLEGFEGQARLAGPTLTELWPLLSALEVIGVGKSTSMGFGSIAVRT